jgi:hypothetical protein
VTTWLAVLITIVNGLTVLANVHTRRRVKKEGDQAVNAAGEAVDVASEAAETVARLAKEARSALVEIRKLLADPYGREDTTVMPSITPGQAQRANHADRARGRHRERP